MFFSVKKNYKQCSFFLVMLFLNNQYQITILFLYFYFLCTTDEYEFLKYSLVFLKVILILLLNLYIFSVRLYSLPGPRPEYYELIPVRSPVLFNTGKAISLATYAPFMILVFKS